MVKPETLENPERGMDLTTRGPVMDVAVRVDVAGAPELQALRARIKALKVTPPEDRAPHCRACFMRGAEAALRALEEG